MDAQPHRAHDTTDPPCPGCSRRRTANEAGSLEWSSEHAPDGTVTYVCPACTRADIAQIETGLPSLRHRSPAA